MTEDLNERDERGLTPLHVSAGRGDAPAVRALLQRGADPRLLDNRMGASPLHLAAQSGSIEVAKLLLAAGAFLNLQAPTHGVTPLIAAVWYRNPELVQYLLEQPDMNAELVTVMGLTARDFIDFGFSENDTYAQQQRERMTALFDAYDQRRAQRLAAQPIYTALTDSELDPQDRTERVRRLIADDQTVDTIVLQPAPVTTDTRPCWWLPATVWPRSRLR